MGHLLLELASRGRSADRASDSEEGRRGEAYRRDRPDPGNEQACRRGTEPHPGRRPGGPADDASERLSHSRLLRLARLDGFERVRSRHEEVDAVGRDAALPQMLGRPARAFAVAKDSPTLSMRVPPFPRGRAHAPRPPGRLEAAFVLVLRL